MDQNEPYVKWNEATSFDDKEIPTEGSIENKKRFPSLDPRAKRNARKRMKREKDTPSHQLSTATTMFAAILKRGKLQTPVEKRPVGRPRKPVLDPPLPKRPIGRPRIHPVKSKGSKRGKPSIAAS
jgi:hypothetical protein